MVRMNKHPQCNMSYLKSCCFSGAVKSVPHWQSKGPGFDFESKYGATYVLWDKTLNDHVKESDGSNNDSPVPICYFFLNPINRNNTCYCQVKIIITITELSNFHLKACTNTVKISEIYTIENNYLA